MLNLPLVFDLLIYMLAVFLRMNIHVYVTFLEHLLLTFQYNSFTYVFFLSLPF